MAILLIIKWVFIIGDLAMAVLYSQRNKSLAHAHAYCTWFPLAAAGSMCGFTAVVCLFFMSSLMALSVGVIAASLPYYAVYHYLNGHIRVFDADEQVFIPKEWTH